jgi:hypothetical protein
MFRRIVYVHDSLEMKNILLKEVHNVPYVSHPGYQRTISTVNKEYYWSGMKKEVADFIARCLECQKVKVEHKHPTRFLQPLSIPEWKLEFIMMDFRTKLPISTKKHDSIMVLVDKLTKDTHFVPMKSIYKEANIANIYMRETSKVHGVTKTIVSNIDPKFTSKFWKGLFKGNGKSLNFSTTYHPK